MRNLPTFFYEWSIHGPEIGSLHRKTNIKPIAFEYTRRNSTIFHQIWLVISVFVVTSYELCSSIHGPPGKVSVERAQGRENYIDGKILSDPADETGYRWLPDISTKFLNWILNFFRYKDKIYLNLNLDENKIKSKYFIEYKKIIGPTNNTRSSG